MMHPNNISLSCTRCSRRRGIHLATAEMGSKRVANCSHCGPVLHTVVEKFSERKPADVPTMRNSKRAPNRRKVS